MVENLTNEESSIEQRELALDQILRICEQRNLLDCAKFPKSSNPIIMLNYLMLTEGRYLTYELLEEHKLLSKSLWDKLQDVVRQYLWKQKHKRSSQVFLGQKQNKLLNPYGSLEYIITKELEQKYNLKLVQGSDLESYWNSEPERERIFLISVTFLSLSVLLLLILLFILTRLQNSHNFPANSHLIAFLPEECVAEMGALARRMKKENVSPWEIRRRLLEEFVTLIWVFYIQIKLENLSLPFQDNQIDE